MTPCLCCVSQEVLGEVVANTWEGSDTLFKMETMVATATCDMALQQLQAAIEVARKSGLNADEVQDALDNRFPRGSVFRMLKAAARVTDDKLSGSDSARLSSRERVALKKLVREALAEDWARVDMVHMLAVDDLLVAEVVRELGGVSDRIK
jgi:hypothetical protein